MFNIIEVVAGWFVFSLHSDTDAFAVDCSNVAGIDIGTQFLDIANLLLKHHPFKHCMCLNDEQRAYRMELHRKNGSVLIRVCELAGGSDAALTAFQYMNASPSALESAAVKSPIFEAEYDDFEFAKSIYLEFAKLDKDVYQRNWFPFPQTEYDTLHQYMKFRI